MKTTKRNFEKSIRKRYQVNPSCPCGKSNKDGKFANELGITEPKIGYYFSCGESFWNNNDSIIKVYRSDIHTPVYNYCNHSWDDLKQTFDSNLESGFAKFLVKTFGEDEAVKAVERYFLGVYDAHGASKHPSTIFWQRIETIRSELVK